MKKIIIWVIAVVVLIIVVGVLIIQPWKGGSTCWPYCPNMTDQDRAQILQQALEAQNNLASSSADTNSDWKTYTNVKYGFTLNYPSNFSLKESQNGGFFDELNLYNLSVSAPADYQKGTDFNVGRIDVIVSSSTAKCYTSSPNSNDLSSVKNINGISFHYNSRQPFSDDAMGGQRGTYSLFATIDNGQCYRITKTVGYRDSSGFTNPPYPLHFNEQSVNADLDNIILSFKFTN